MVFLPLLWCQRRPQDYAPLFSIDCVDLVRCATRTASPAESSRPSIFNCRALPKRERERAVSNLTSTYCRRKKNRNMHYFLCACQQKCERRKGKEEFLLCRKSEEEWVRQPCLVPLVSNKPNLEEKESEISYHREK